VLSVYGIFQQAHETLDFEAMPDLLKPLRGRFGLKDYRKMYCPDLKNGRDIYTMRGIDREQGCMILVRPDQYIAHVLPLDAYAELSQFFDGFMR
jgi:phenol 2-monooxygenase